MNNNLIIDIFDIIFEFVYGPGIDERELSSEEAYDLVNASQRITLIVLQNTENIINSMSFICAGCNRSIIGPPKKLGNQYVCPGCFNYNMLSHEVMKRGLNKEYDETIH